MLRGNKRTDCAKQNKKGRSRAEAYRTVGAGGGEESKIKGGTTLSDTRTPKVRYNRKIKNHSTRRGHRTPGNTTTVGASGTKRKAKTQSVHIVKHTQLTATGCGSEYRIKQNKK